MKIVLSILIILHGLIHLLGFTKAFNLASVNQLTQHISKVNGVLWLVAAILFVTTAILFFIEKEWWWVLSVFAIIISQYLIFKSWQDAKMGTIANAIILLIIVIGYKIIHK